MSCGKGGDDESCVCFFFLPWGGSSARISATDSIVLDGMFLLLNEFVAFVPIYLRALRWSTTVERHIFLCWYLYFL